MRLVTKSALAALWLLCVGFLVAPAATAGARVPAENHPSSDAPWLIGLLVLILLGLGALFLLFRRGMSRRTNSGDFR
jgi:O-antigen/teichoic acid export membrane protein